MSETPADGATPNPTREGQRIAKVMARAGLCSRRDAEAWILEGRVSVNGAPLESPAFNVTAEDDIRVDGQPLREPERTRLFLFHKPKGLVTTARDPEGRPTIFDALPEDLPRVVAVGRLDINTEGLLLLTNDGGLARVLELPATAWLRRYRVRAHGAIEQAQLDSLREGVTIEGVHYAGIEARLEREQGSNVWMMIGLREGKNREIKRVLEHLGMSVNRLIRVSFGPFELGDLAEGELAEVRSRVLRDQLGAKLAREAGVDFEAPLRDDAPPPAEPPPSAKRGARTDRPPSGGRERPRREGFAADSPPRRSEPEPARLPRKRKHVSALRGEAAAEAAGPRRRVERGATSDRKGREIKVERIVAAVPVASKGGGSGPKRRPRAADGKSFEDRAPAGDRSPSRGGKPFRERGDSREGRGAPRGESRPFEKRASPGEGGGAPERAGKPFRERAPAGEGRTPSRSFEKRAGSDVRPPRGEGRTYEKRSFGEGGGAPERAGKPFRERPPAGEGLRPARSFEKRPPGEGRPASRNGGKPFAARPFAKRPPSGEGRGPPRGGASGGKRPPRRP